MITLTATITKNDGSLINLNYRNSLSLERTIYDRSDLKLPSWGIISNGGNLRFVDSDGTIKRLAEQRLLKSGMKVNFYLENTLSKAKANVGQFLTNQWNYNNDNKQVSVSLKDELEEWQDILLNPVGYNPNSETNLSFEWLYKYIYTLTPTKYDMLDFENLDNQTKSILTNSHFEFFIFTAKTLWNAWTQLCQACQCHIFKNNDGITVCRYNGGN